MKKQSRSAGILMPVSSLPSPYGIGTLGKSAYAFVDWLHRAGAKIWQVLPLLPTGYGDSPYQSCASNALNYYLIDFDMLAQEGLLLPDDYQHIVWGETPRRVNYGILFEQKTKVLRKAFARFDRSSASWQAFLEKGEYRDFALYMSLKRRFEYKCWTEWGEYRVYDPQTIEGFARENAEEVEFWQFTQYLFERQWNALKDYCHARDVQIMGDMPIYISFDSVEMWKYGKELFLLDEEGSPALVAGVPPDAFSEDGQLWGNPVYHWQAMKKDDYSWWKRRISNAFRLYDIVRIDHFRGFDRFYAIPAGSENARNGLWLDGPKAELFQEFLNHRIVAEDLGVIDEGVLKLMKDTGYPGMKIIEFAFDGNPANEHKPSNYDRNFVAYTGTHDNMPLLGHITEMNEERKRALDIDLTAECEALGITVELNSDEARCNAILELLFASVADTVITPMHDLYLLGEEARLNLPSIVSPQNWSYRFLAEEIDEEHCQKLAELIAKYQR